MKIKWTTRLKYAALALTNPHFEGFMYFPFTRESPTLGRLVRFAWHILSKNVYVSSDGYLHTDWYPVYPPPGLLAHLRRWRKT